MRTSLTAILAAFVLAFPAYAQRACVPLGSGPQP